MTKYAFILSWERPIYLWACLDSLYRNTRRDVNFVLVDNNSQDPLIKSVIQGFVKRQMFHDVRMCRKNDPLRLRKLFRKYEKQIDEFFYFVESDCVVPESPCWATEYERIYRAYPGTGMVGSFPLTDDFVDPELIREQSPAFSDEQIAFYSKSSSPARTREVDPSLEVLDDANLNPPGRLLLLDKKAVQECGIHCDSVMADTFRTEGYRCLFATRFRHRHLSLLNYFDAATEEYRVQRSRFMSELYEKSQPSLFRRMKRRVYSAVTTRASRKQQ